MFFFRSKIWKFRFFSVTFALHHKHTKAMVNKHVQNYLKGLAEEINGKYTEYSGDIVIVTLPLADGRYQNVKGYITPRGDGIMLEFRSKVCNLSEVPDVNPLEFLEMNREFCYAKIMCEDGYLEVAASTKYELCTYDQVRYMIFEVAQTADNLEKKLTGVDVY
jgi:hypothetical protein